MDYRERRTVVTKRTESTCKTWLRHGSTAGMIIGFISLIYKCFTNTQVMAAVTSIGKAVDRGHKFEELVKGIK